MKSSKKVRIIGVISVVALIVILLVCYVRPRTIDTILDLHKRNLSSIQVSATFVEDSSDADGVSSPRRMTYEISGDEAELEAIMELLRSSRYRYELRSLFPRRSVSNGTGSIMLTFNYDKGRYDLMDCAEKVVFGLNSSPGGLIIADATDDTLYSRLSDYVLEARGGIMATFKRRTGSCSLFFFYSIVIRPSVKLSASTL